MNIIRNFKDHNVIIGFKMTPKVCDDDDYYDDEFQHFVPDQTVDTFSELHHF